MSIISMSHGGGGTLQNQLIRNEIAPRFANTMLQSLPDGAVTPEELVISSDSFVITPRFFPGGDIGKLAVAGSVNDVLVAGGIPKYLTCSLIIEEGLRLDELRRILDSMAAAAKICNVQIVTGDTKVVPRGNGDGVYINTTAVGFKRHGMLLQQSRFVCGDKIIVSRSIGEHGLSVLAQRYDLECGNLTSDCACLDKVVETLHDTAGSSLKFMRDATRGGVLGIIDEIFYNTACGAVVNEESLPISPEASAAAKLLGIDPGFAACEGCLTAVISSDRAAECVEKLRELKQCRQAAIIGEVTADQGVLLRGVWGSLRKLHIPAGDQLPRIC